LNITGNARHDSVSLYEMASDSVTSVADKLRGSWTDDLGQKGSQTYNTASLTKIVFRGNGGNDTFKNVSNPQGLERQPTSAILCLHRVVSSLRHNGLVQTM